MPTANPNAPELSDAELNDLVHALRP